MGSMLPSALSTNRNGRVSSGGSSAAEVVWFLGRYNEPQVHSQGYPRGPSDDTKLSCSELIFHDKEKQQNSSFAAQ